MKINPRDIKVRDYNLLRIIQGVTKSGFQKNRLKDSRKYACRGEGEDSETGEECDEEE
jgi:hypothetical protein